jgi:hypothetical protein
MLTALPCKASRYTDCTVLCTTIYAQHLLHNLSSLASSTRLVQYTTGQLLVFSYHVCLKMHAHLYICMLQVCVVMTDFHAAVLQERMQLPSFNRHLATGTSAVTLYMYFAQYNFL